MKLLRPSAFAGLLVLAAPAYAADTYLFSLTNQSSVTIAPDFAIVTQGHLIGSFDATTNPGGTQTRPGLFGGSGNNAIPATIDFALAGSDTTVPAGSLRVELNLPDRAFTLAGLSTDLLGSSALEVPLTVGLLYDTFRTVAPNSLYVGGARLPIPFGNATISTLAITQTAQAAGVLAATDTPNVYTFSTLAPATLTASASLLTQTFDLPPTPIALPVTGTLDLRAAPTMTLSWDVTIDEDLPPDLIEQLPPIENQPLDLPTILPPGATAHLLLNLAVTSGRVASRTTAALTASGVVLCPADFNQDGIIDAFDYADFVQAFESGNPAADFNRDAFLDFFDYSDFVVAFTTGC